jgi:hypothetical protein
MSSPRVFERPNARSSAQEQSHGRSGSNVTSLLAFLEEENRRLQNMVAKLKRDTLALQQALQDN